MLGFNTGLTTNIKGGLPKANVSQLKIENKSNRNNNDNDNDNNKQ